MRSHKKYTGKTAGFRNVLALGLVSFFTDLSSDMVFSLLPTFILGLPGSSAAILGVIEGIAEDLSYSLRAISGLLSDKIRRRKIIVLIGYAFSNIVKPLFAVAKSVVDALIIRVSDRVGKAVRTAPRDALLSESVSEERRGVAFGIHRALDQSGAIVGPLLASLLLFFGLSVRTIFWLSLIPGSIALFLLAFLVQERVSKPSEAFRMLRNVKELLHGDFLSFLMVVSLFSLGAFNFSFILLNASESGVADALIPIVYLVINLAHTLIAIPAGLLSDRMGRENALTLGYGIFLLTCLLIFSLPKRVSCAFTVAFFFGLYMGIIETVQRALIPKYAERGYLRGTAYGIYYLTVGSAFLAANMFVGLLWQRLGSSAAMIYSILMAVISILGMMILIARKTRE